MILFSQKQFSRCDQKSLPSWNVSSVHYAIVSQKRSIYKETRGRFCGTLRFGYSTDSLETRGVFRGFFVKNPSFTAKIPSRSDLEWDFRKLQYTPSIGEFYGENPIAKRFGMGFSQATVHALDRACTVARSAVLFSSI